jgi:hypothetical protein
MQAEICQKKVICYKRSTCRTCGAPLQDILDFGEEMPLAGSFISQDETLSKDFVEHVYPMQVSFCEQCALVQIPNVIPKEDLFNAHYHYRSSVIGTLQHHFKQYAEVIGNVLHSQTKSSHTQYVVEFGCNDGVLLAHLRDLGIKAIGVDASANIVELGRSQGLDIINGFFNTQIAVEIAQEHGKASVITGSNVFAHNDDVTDILDGAKVLLDDHGYLLIEVHYLGALIEQVQFDFFYHEHCNYYSLHSLQYLLDLNSFDCVDAEIVPMHSGSLRVYAMKKDHAGEKTKRYEELLQEEKKAGLNSLYAFNTFIQKVHQAGSDLVAVLRAYKAEGKIICGYGASGRSVTMLNYYGITSELIDFMVDASPLRAGHYMPGLHIPIYFPEKERLEQADICLITAWSYQEEIVKKEDWMLEEGKHFVIPLPKVEVLGK